MMNGRVVTKAIAEPRLGVRGEAERQNVDDFRIAEVGAR